MANRILVIDDEQGIREGVKRALTPQGYIVETAENGEQGLALFRKEPFDLVLIDVMMPGISGIDLIREIHQVDPDAICIIITGYATVEMAVRAIKEGAYDFLTKPFTIDDLLLVVRQGLERRQLSLETQRLRRIEEQARKLEEEKARLEELDRAKMQFVRLVTHELQAPIAAIHTYLRLILDGYVSPEEQRRVLEKCLARAQEQMKLISDLLMLGRIQAQIQEGKVEELNMDEVLQSVVERMEPQAKEKGLEFRVWVQPASKIVLGNRDHFLSVWTNLISNAIKYTERGFVEVTLRTEDGKVIGEVKDSGIGIPEDEQPHLFEEFFRASNAKKGSQQGTGLGLSIVKRVIEASGGEVWVRSKEGEGSLFGFWVPLAKEETSNS
ncbi:MAG: hybrid sensor histidine kinase/response regulator [Anaerolineales bacterium]|nr:hybrid sensor histidine kinase/response regulator [Anaerolineales bacterium]MDW8446429.1 hybrid sensor histidine kinase/response regulator [Anaerolineales bacterium]